MDAATEAAYEAMFVGNRVRVRPVADAIVVAEGLDGVDDRVGDDVTISATRLYMALATPERQFGLFFPASGRRLTLRLRLEGTVAPSGRLQSTADRAPEGRFDTVAHLAHPDHVDGDLVAALRAAYRLAR